MNVITNISTWMKWAHTAKTEKRQKSEQCGMHKAGKCSYFTAMKRKIWVSGHWIQASAFHIYIKQVWTHTRLNCSIMIWTTEKSGRKKAAHFDRPMQPIDHRTHYQIDACESFSIHFPPSRTHPHAHYWDTLKMALPIKTNTENNKKELFANIEIVLRLSHHKICTEIIIFEWKIRGKSQQFFFSKR